jgi:hypothetical protein
MTTSMPSSSACTSSGRSAATRGYSLGSSSPWEDTAFSITLVWITLFGDALFGSIARASVGLSDDFATGHRFRRWMADRFEEAGPPRAASLIATPAAAAASESRGAPTRNRPSRRA